MLDRTGDPDSLKGMLIDFAHLATGLAVLFVPGLLLLYVCGVRSWAVLAGVAVPLTAGLALLVSVVTGVTGIPFHLLSFVVITALVAVLAGVIRRWALPRIQARAKTAGTVSGTAPSHQEGVRELRGKTLAAARVLGLLTGLAGIVLGWWMWQRGLGSWSTPPQEHDQITHSVITAYIEHTGNAAPWQMRPLDLVEGEPLAYYPSGFSRLAALVVNVVGDTMTSLNLVTVVILAIAWPLSAAALTAVLIRLSGLGKGWVALAAGIAMPVAVSLYRPAIALAHDGGIVPNAAALVMVPGLVAVMLLTTRQEWKLVIPLGIACAGVFSVHPSAVVSVVLTLLAAWIGLLLTASGRAWLRSTVMPLLAVSAVALVFGIPVLAGLIGGAESVTGAPATIGPTAFGTALENTFALTYHGYFDPRGEESQLAIGMLAVAGVVAVAVFRRGWPIATVYLFWAGVSLTFQLSPNSGPASTVAGYFYNSFTRLQSHVSFAIPALVAGLFVFSAVAFLSIPWPRMQRPRFLPGRPVIALSVLTAGIAALLSTSILSYVEMNSTVLARRYKEPEFTRYDAADEVAMAWLDRHVQPGERILNNANDGSTLAYVRYELPILNTVSTGSRQTPESTELLKSFDNYPDNPEVRSILLDKNIRWVYVDSEAPVIGALPSDWHGQSEYSFAPGLEDLEGLPGLEEAFTQDHVTVYRLDLEVVGAL